MTPDHAVLLAALVATYRISYAQAEISWATLTWRVGNFVDAFWRSFILGLIVMVLTVAISVMAGLGFRHKFMGSNFVFYLTISSLIVPSILVSLGIGIAFSLLGLDNHWYSSTLGGI